jgi:hypothetical protein
MLAVMTACRVRAISINCWSSISSLTRWIAPLLFFHPQKQESVSGAVDTAHGTKKDLFQCCDDGLDVAHFADCSPLTSSRRGSVMTLLLCACEYYSQSIDITTKSVSKAAWSNNTAIFTGSPVKKQSPLFTIANLTNIGEPTPTGKNSSKHMVPFLKPNKVTRKPPISSLFGNDAVNSLHWKVPSTTSAASIATRGNEATLCKQTKSWLLVLPKPSKGGVSRLMMMDHALLLPNHSWLSDRHRFSTMVPVLPTLTWFD